MKATSLNNNFLEFSLSLDSYTTDFDFSPNNYGTKIELAGINWYEPFSDYFHAGLELGYIEMSQINNPLSSAQFTSGQYAGLLLKLLPINTPPLSLVFNLNYRYNRSKGKSPSQDTTFAWNETLVASELQLRALDNLHILLAADYQMLSGEQRNSGSLTQLIPFKGSEQLGYRIGLNFISSHSGTIGLQWFTGFKSGTRVYFSRTF